MEKASTSQIHVRIWVANLGMLLENRGYNLPESLRDLVVLVIRTNLGSEFYQQPALGSSALRTP